MDNTGPLEVPDRPILLARQSMKQDDKFGTTNQVEDLLILMDDLGIPQPPDKYILIEDGVSGWAEKPVKDRSGRITGYSPDRPFLDLAIGWLESGERDSLFVYTCDRGMRNVKVFQRLVDIVRKSCPTEYDPPTIYCWSVDGTFDLRTKEGIRATRNRVNDAEDQSDATSARVSTGYLRRARRGIFGHPSNGRIYGFDKCDPGTVRNPCEKCNGSRAVQAPEEAQALQIAAEGVLDYKTWKEIESDIRRKMPGYIEGRFTGYKQENFMGVISGALRREVIAGYPVYHGKPLRDDEIIKDPLWEPILDKETWKRVQDILDSPARTLNTKGGRKVRLLGSGLFRCSMPDCDGVMGYNVRKDETEREAHYSCGTCNRQYRPASIVDRIVREKIAAHFTKLGAKGLSSKRRPDYSQEITDLRERYRDLKRQEDDVTAEFREAGDRTRLKLLADIGREKRSIEAKIAKLEERSSQNDATDGMNGTDLAAMWDETDDDDLRRDIIRKAAVVWIGPTSRRGRIPAGAPEDESNIEVKFLSPDGTVPPRPPIARPRSTSIDEIERVTAIMEEMFTEYDICPIEEVLDAVGDNLHYKIIQNIRRELGLVARQAGSGSEGNNLWVWMWPDADIRAYMKAKHCGTYNGYYQHIRRNEKPCDPCSEAKREQAKQ